MKGFCGEKMFGLGKNQIYTIGVDINRDGLRLAQLAERGQEMNLLAGRLQERPARIELGTASWQHWAVDTIKEAIGHAGFKGKKVTAALAPSDVFIDNFKIPKVPEGKLSDALFARLKNQLHYRGMRDNTIIKYFPTEQDNGMMIVVDQQVIDRHLAVLEKSGVEINTMGVWPEALVNCYVRFFGRRKSDANAVVMLVNADDDCVNVVICRHRKLLYARTLSLGISALSDENNINRLVLEVTACRRDFSTLYPNTQVSRLIFLSGPVLDTSIYAAIAKQMEVQAQIGDCLVAVEVAEPLYETMDRRDHHVSWATAFGLSLS